MSTWSRQRCSNLHLFSYLSKPVQHLDKSAAADSGRFVYLGAKIFKKYKYVQEDLEGFQRDLQSVKFPCLCCVFCEKMSNDKDLCMS